MLYSISNIYVNISMMNVQRLNLDFLSAVDSRKVVLVLLNQDWLPGNWDNEFYNRFKILWGKATFKAAVDGGTNILHNVNLGRDNGEKYIPDLISGDFDSVKLDVLDYYKGQGVEIIQTLDQDFTDFSKCIKIIGEKYKDGCIPFDTTYVVCLLENSNRFDHTMANINTLYRARSMLPPHVHVSLLMKNVSACLLSPGRSTICRCYRETSYANSCGFFPVGCPAVVKTIGFKKDLNDDVLRFETSVTELYEFDRDTVSVTTDEALVCLLHLL